jgi:hypothetical protein
MIVVDYVSLKPISVTPCVSLIYLLCEIISCRLGKTPRSIEIVRVVCYFNSDFVNLLVISGVLSLYQEL